MTWKLMKMICLAHQKRGEEVLEFNLNPIYFSKLKNKYIVHNERIIPIVSKGWIEVGNYNYLELITTEGLKYVPDLTYTLK